MAAYAFFDNLAVRDAAGLEEYKRRAHDVVTAHGGRYVVLGGETDRLEGEWQPVFPVMIEFPDLEAARRWYDAPEYAELKALRQASVDCNAVLIGGL